MLRWLIAILILANLLAFGLASGMLGPLPSSGPREPSHLNRQVHPEMLKVEPVAPAAAAAQVTVGQADPTPVVAASALSQ